MESCVMGKCTTSSDDDIYLYAFPKKVLLRKIWERFVKMTRKDWSESHAGSKICARHFKDEDYSKEIAAICNKSKKKLRRILKADAAPTILYPPKLVSISKGKVVYSQYNPIKISATGIKPVNSSNDGIIITKNISSARGNLLPNKASSSYGKTPPTTKVPQIRVLSSSFPKDTPRMLYKKISEVKIDGVSKMILVPVTSPSEINLMANSSLSSIKTTPETVSTMAPLNFTHSSSSSSINTSSSKTSCVQAQTNLSDVSFTNHRIMKELRSKDTQNTNVLFFTPSSNPIRLNHSVNNQITKTVKPCAVVAPSTKTINMSPVLTSSNFPSIEKKRLTKNGCVRIAHQNQNSIMKNSNICHTDHSYNMVLPSYIDQFASRKPILSTADDSNLLHDKKPYHEEINENVTISDCFDESIQSIDKCLSIFSGHNENPPNVIEIKPKEDFCESEIDKEVDFDIFNSMNVFSSSCSNSPVDVNDFEVLAEWTSGQTDYANDHISSKVMSHSANVISSNGKCNLISAYDGADNSSPPILEKFKPDFTPNKFIPDEPPLLEQEMTKKVRLKLQFPETKIANHHFKNVNDHSTFSLLSSFDKIDNNPKTVQEWMLKHPTIFKSFVLEKKFKLKDDGEIEYIDSCHLKDCKFSKAVSWQESKSFRIRYPDILSLEQSLDMKPKFAFVISNSQQASSSSTNSELKNKANFLLAVTKWGKFLVPTPHNATGIVMRSPDGAVQFNKLLLNDLSKIKYQDHKPIIVFDNIENANISSANPPHFNFQGNEEDIKITDFKTGKIRNIKAEKKDDDDDMIVIIDDDKNESIHSSDTESCDSTLEDDYYDSDSPPSPKISKCSESKLSIQELRNNLKQELIRLEEMKKTLHQK